jgi:hypothetical protein
MNDAHDNAATDKGMLIKFNTDNAIQAFQSLQKARLRLDEAEYQLEKTIGMGIDKERYDEQAEDILKEYKRKRWGAVKAGKLPRGKVA